MPVPHPERPESVGIPKTVGSNPDTHDSRLCGANRTKAEGTCRRPAGWGTDHVGIGRCKLHGGASPKYRKRAQRIAAERAVAQLGLTRDVDPHTALLEELARTAGQVAWLHEYLAASERLSELTQESSDGTPELSVWVRLYQDERGHLVKIAKTCIDAGVEERRVRIAEQTGLLIAQVIRGVLTDLGVADRSDVPMIVRRHLTAIDAQASDGC